MSNLELHIPGLLLASFVGLCILYFLFRKPEITFALFLFSYIIEGGDLIPGLIDLTPILLFISFAGFFFPAIMKKTIQYSSKSSDIWLLIFLFILFGGSYLTPDLQSGLKKAILFAVAVVLPYMIVRFFFKTYKQIKVFLITIIVLATGIALILIFISFSPIYYGGRLQLFEANPIPTATLLAVGLIIAVIGLNNNLFSKTIQGKAICIAIIPLCLYGMFLSGVRGPLISVVIGLAFYLLIMYIRQPRMWIRMATIVFLLLMTFNIWNPYIASKVPNSRLYNPREIIKGASAQQRLERYQATKRLFAQRPLFGGGTDGYAQRTAFNYPHNIFLEIVSDNGLIGLLVFLCFLISVLRYAILYLTKKFRISHQSEKAIGLIILVIVVTLFIEKQISCSLTTHKDLFSFLAIIVNLPSLSSNPNVKASKNAIE